MVAGGTAAFDTLKDWLFVGLSLLVVGTDGGTDVVGMDGGTVVVVIGGSSNVVGSTRGLKMQWCKVSKDFKLHRFVLV